MRRAEQRRARGARLGGAALLLLSSCSALSMQIGHAADPALLAAFEVGRTRRADVLAVLGPPTSLAAHGDGVAFVYEQVTLDELQLGISLDSVGRALGVSDLGFFKFSLGDSDVHHDAAVLIFDSEAVLQGAGHERWSEEFGEGSSLQIVVTVDQVVDTGTLDVAHAARVWGREDLAPLPRTLNQANRADLELRGTGVKAGQETLGMLDFVPTDDD